MASLDTIAGYAILGALALSIAWIAVLVLRTMAGSRAAKRQLRRTLIHGAEDELEPPLEHEPYDDD